MIIKAMNEVNCKINPSKTAKPQAIGFINDLKKVLPIDRTRMHLRVTCPAGAEQAETIHKWLTNNHANQFKIENQSQKESAVVLVISIEPALFREISNVVK